MLAIVETAAGGIYTRTTGKRYKIRPRRRIRGTRGSKERHIYGEKFVGITAFVFGLLVTAGAALAHHGSRAYYNMNKQVTVTGTVTYFAWQNPHVYVLFDVNDSQGRV